MSGFLILVIAIVVVAFAVVAMYNGLVRKKNEAQEAWSGIEVQMKRRHDLIPNLVNTVKGYATHEKELLANVTKARSEAVSAKGVVNQADKENMLSSTLRSLFAVAENYPDLKADANFRQLQTELTDTEDKLMSARRFYNSAVKSLNVALESFPSNVIGNMFGFVKREFFELDEGERAAAEKPPKVEF